MTDLERLAYVIMPAITVIAATFGSTTVYLLSRGNRKRADIVHRSDVAVAQKTPEASMRQASVMKAIWRALELATVVGLLSRGRRR